MGYAPKLAVEGLVAKTGTALDQIDQFEINEAFASQSVAVQRDLNIPAAKLNRQGGAIALGHPLGASGARLLTTLVHQLNGDQRGIASLCVGGGIGVAMQVHHA